MQIRSEISPHNCQKGYYQKDYKQQVLARIWRRGNTCALLVGLQVGTDAIQNIMKILWKIKNRSSLMAHWVKDLAFALSGLGLCCGTGLIPVPRTSTCHRGSQKKKKKIKTELPSEPAILCPYIFLNKTKTLIWKDICTPMFTAILFTIAKIQKQPKCAHQ